MLTDIGTEELAHIEMISAILYQLTRSMTMQQIKDSGIDAYFIDHTAGIYPQAASGVPFSAGSLQVTGDAVADLFEDLAAEGTTVKEQQGRQSAALPFISPANNCVFAFLDSDIPAHSNTK